MFKRGSVVLTPFPFTDLSSSKLRPSVIVSKSNHNRPDLVVAFISSIVDSRLRKIEVVIPVAHKDFKQTGLRMQSVVRCDKLATLDKRILIGELGRLSPPLQTKVDDALRYGLGL